MSDLRLNTDGHIIKFGADNDINITHVADTGLTTNGTFQATTITATTAVVPDASDGAALGTTALEWSDLFLADGGIIKFGNDQDVLLTHVADTGLLLNGTNVIQFNDASQNIGAPSATVLDINATDEIELNATLVDLNGNLDVSGTTLLPTLGVGAAKDLGVGLHIKSGDSGASVNSGGDELVIEGSGTTGMSILSATNATGGIFFGDSGGNARSIVKYDHSTDLFKIDTAAATAFTMNQDGIINKPLQPAFLATKSGHQADVPINATTTVVFDSEVFDNNADFNTSNYTFTAPVTGRYQFNALINWNSWDTNFGYVWHRITASNRVIFANLAGGQMVASDGYFFAPSSVLVDMDANDTCKYEVQFSNDGAAQADLQSSSWFSGYLVC